mmetsp:Transcript_9704/g.36411  ORF Transcript_9704/g.36411 Transcript_9704/m.36411 type:complete len:165 (-) Transcript_9704:1089-1583(-)|eukprot:scaffold2144_cov215-Pinguiococcus_pyrenoidosus.AAC.5
MKPFLAKLVLGCLVLLACSDGARSKEGRGIYTLGVKDSFMIAHSFKGNEFGPAQNLHGATYVVEVEFSAPRLVPKLNWVMNLDDAKTALAEVLGKYHLKNLDDVVEDENTTTEYMCRRIFGDLCDKLPQFRGRIGVKLHESHTGWASYVGTIGADAAKSKAARK